MNIKVSKLEWSGGSNRTDMDISRKETVSVAVSPENASNKNIEWSIESEPGDGKPGDVIELTPHGLSADVTAIGKGHAIIVAKSTDGSNLEIKYDIYVHWAKIYITTSNVEYQSIVDGVNYDDDLVIVDRNLELRGDVPWEKLKSTLSFSVPAGYTMTYTDYEDPDWVYTKGYIEIKNSAGKTVDDFYLTYYVNNLKAGYKPDNSQVKFKGIIDGDDWWDIYLGGDVPWSEVNKEQLNFTCVDHPSYGFAESDGSDGGGDMYICDGDDYICNIYFRLIQE